METFAMIQKRLAWPFKRIYKPWHWSLLHNIQFSTKTGASLIVFLCLQTMYQKLKDNK